MKWPKIELVQIARLVGGGTPSKDRPEFWIGKIPWVSPKDMNGREILDTQDHITEAAVAESATQIVPEKSILVVVRSGILVRRLPVAIARVRVALNQDIKALIPRYPLLPEFLAYFLEASAKFILNQYVKRGATVHSVDVARLSQLEVPLPAHSEQMKIVSILNEAAALQQKHQEAHEKSSRILSALFYKTFGDPLRNPMGWPSSNLGEVILAAQYGTSVKTGETNQGIPVLRMNNIDTAGFLDLAELKYASLSADDEKNLILRPGDLLFNRTNSRELVGKTAIWRGELEEAVPASYLIRIRVDERRVRPEYVWAYMNTAFMKQTLFARARRAIGMANINTEEIRSLPFFVPPLNQQSKFIEQQKDAIQVREGLSRQKITLDALFSLMLRHAFSGQLTAEWRHSRMKELLAEIEEQMRSIGASQESLLC